METTYLYSYSYNTISTFFFPYSSNYCFATFKAAFGYILAHCNPPRRQIQANLVGFMTSLLYMTSFRTARST